VLWIDNTLEEVQTTVGGYMQTAPLDLALSVVCNQEGLHLGLSENRLGIRGTFLVVRIEGSAFVSLTKADVDRARFLLGG
jgi:hypothetical protein